MNSSIQELIMFLKESGASIENPRIVLNADSIILEYNFDKEKKFKRNEESIKDIFLKLDKGLRDEFEDSDCLITALSFSGASDTEDNGIRFLVTGTGFSFLLGFTSTIEEERDWIYEFCTRMVLKQYYNSGETKKSQEIIEFIDKINKIWDERYRNIEESIQSHM